MRAQATPVRMPGPLSALQLEQPEPVRVTAPVARVTLARAMDGLGSPRARDLSDAESDSGE